MIYQFAVNISTCSDRQIQELYKILSKERKARISRYLSQKDRIRSVISETVLRYGLQKEMGMKNSDIRFGYGQYHKPFLENDKDIFFNLSHSGEWVYCGIADVELGVDVEYIKDGCIDIANRFFNLRESEYINEQPTFELQKEVFYKLWTLKESYVKAVGKGLNIKLDSFYFEWDGVYISIIVDGSVQKEYRFVSQKIDTEHWVALCFLDKNKEKIVNGINNITVHQLVDFSHDVS